MTGGPKIDPSLLDRVHVGDAAELAQLLPVASIDCVITSPPYFGHRRYSSADDEREIGVESNVDDYVNKLVKYFDSIAPLLRDDGSMWLNLGDTYRQGRLLGVPWRVALSLQDAGWCLRSEVIWHKPNAMPSSVKNRPTVDHEHLFLLSRGNHYYYDADAIREPHVTFSNRSKMRGGRGHFGKREGTPERGKNGGNSNLHDARWDQAFHPLGRNKRTVWSVPLGKFRGAHFAVYPPQLVEPCVLASSRVDGVVLDPFAGAGSTGIAALGNRRRFIGFELVSQNADVANKRLEQQSRMDSTGC